MTRNEVAALFEADVKTIDRWAKAGKFGEGALAHTPGGQRRFRRGVIEQYARDNGYEIG